MSITKTSFFHEPNKCEVILFLVNNIIKLNIDHKIINFHNKLGEILIL